MMIPFFTTLLRHGRAAITAIAVAFGMFGCNAEPSQPGVHNKMVCPMQLNAASGGQTECANSSFEHQANTVRENTLANVTVWDPEQLETGVIAKVGITAGSSKQQPLHPIMAQLAVKSVPGLAKGLSVVARHESGQTESGYVMHDDASQVALPLHAFGTWEVYFQEGPLATSEDVAVAGGAKLAVPLGMKIPADTKADGPVVYATGGQAILYSPEGNNSACRKDVSKNGLKDPGCLQQTVRDIIFEFSFRDRTPGDLQYDAIFDKVIEPSRTGEKFELDIDGESIGLSDQWVILDGAFADALISQFDFASEKNHEALYPIAKPLTKFGELLKTKLQGKSILVGERAIKVVLFSILENAMAGVIADRWVNVVTRPDGSVADLGGQLKKLPGLVEISKATAAEISVLSDTCIGQALGFFASHTGEEIKDLRDLHGWKCSPRAVIQRGWGADLPWTSSMWHSRSDWLHSTTSSEERWFDMARRASLRETIIRDVTEIDLVKGAVSRDGCTTVQCRDDFAAAMVRAYLEFMAIDNQRDSAQELADNYAFDRVFCYGGSPYTHLTGAADCQALSIQPEAIAALALSENARLKDTQQVRAVRNAWLRLLLGDAGELVLSGPAAVSPVSGAPIAPCNSSITLDTVGTEAGCAQHFWKVYGPGPTPGECSFSYEMKVNCNEPIYAPVTGTVEPLPHNAIGESPIAGRYVCITTQKPEATATLSSNGVRSDWVLCVGGLASTFVEAGGRIVTAGDVIGTSSAEAQEHQDKCSVWISASRHPIAQNGDIRFSPPYLVDPAQPGVAACKAVLAGHTMDPMIFLQKVINGEPVE